MNSDKKIQELLNSDPEKGLEELLNLYGGTVKIICRNILAGFSNEDVEEAVADSLIAFWVSRKGLIDAISVKGYLIGITKRTAYKKIRAKLKKPIPLVIDDLDLEIDIDVFNETALSINKEIIHNVISSIPEFEREVFIRRYYYCERIKSIADGLNCNEKKIENILYRYKNKLKSKLIEGGIII